MRPDEGGRRRENWKAHLRFCDARTKPRKEMVVTLALILTFSPREKEQHSYLSGFADYCPANPVAGFRVRRQMILPLLGGEGRGEGEREAFFNVTGFTEIQLVALESDL